MPFDLNSAKPVDAPSGGFDLSTATAVDSSEEENNKKLKNIGSKALGILDAAGQMVVGIPAQIAGGLTGLAKLTSGQGLEAAAHAVEDTAKSNFGFGSGALSEKGKDYTEKTMEALATPGELAGQGAEALGLDPIYGKLPVDAAMNFLPIHGVFKAPGIILDRLGKRGASFDPATARPVEPSVAEKVADLKPKEPVAKPIPTEAQHELFDQPEQGYGANKYGANVGDWRVDENGMPVRVDLSMDAQHMQEPLQRHLWGDENPPVVDPIGQAATLEEGVRQYQEQPMQGGIPLTQAIDSMDPAARSEALQREFPPGELFADGPLKGAILEANSPFTGYGGSQAGALNPEVFKQGYRAVNKILSDLTDMPWVKARFPSNKYLTNKDGTPMILLHGTREGFADRVRATGEGIHAGYGAEAAHMFTRDRKTSARSNALPSRVKANAGAAIYPMAVRNGIYPYIDKDVGAWSAQDILNTSSDVPNQTIVNAIAKETGRSPFTVETIMDDFYRSLYNQGLDTAEWNKEFSDFLDRQFNIRGFFYKNTYESTKSTLINHAGEYPTPKRARALADKLDHNTSFVTWDENNLESLYGNNPMQLGEQKPASWMDSLNSGMSKGQRGALNFGDLFGGKKQAAQTNSLPTEDLKLRTEPLPSSLGQPRTPEHITEKTTLANKADALKLGDTPYHRVTTMEEAISGIDPRADKWRYSPDALRSGIAAVARSNVANKPINYVRNLFQEARNSAAKNSEKYITGKDGLNNSYRTLNTEDKVGVMGAMQAFDKNKIEPTADTLKQVGLSDNATTFVLKLREALKARYATANDALMQLGFEPFQDRPGYSPNMFSGAYTSFGGKWVKDGEGKKFVTTHVLQGDTRAQHAAAVKAALAENPDLHITQRTKRGFNTKVGGNNNTYNGFNDLVAQLAKLDPDFAKAKTIVDQHAADQASSLYRFDVHEIKKAGVKGSLGDRPWLSKEQNAKEWYEGVLNYLETGFRVDSMMGPLAETSKLITHPDMIEKMPNTVKYLEKYRNHIAGNDLNLAGALGNAVANTLTNVFGVGPSTARDLIRGGTSISSASMMGFPNLGFGVMQLTQFVTGGAPEALALRSALGIDPMEMVNSHVAGTKAIAQLALGIKDGVPQHLVEAHQWAKDVGMFDYSEAELSKEVFRSRGVQAFNNVIQAPTVIGERFTRPPLFMVFADAFHKAGFKGEDAFLRAQEATNTAMGDYHPDERPMIYSSLGEIGHLAGALSTYKHNFIEQLINKASNVPKNPASGAAVLAIAFTLYGIGGFPGMPDVDKIVQKLSGKSIRELTMSNPDEPNALLDGWISAKTGMDFQSRLSQGQMVPDSPVSALPHVAWWANVFSKAYTAAKDMDTASLKDLGKAATPVGLRGILETKTQTDASGDLVNSQGQKKYPSDFKRTPEEIRYREILGIKPLREKLYDENTRTMVKRQMSVDDKNKDIAKRLVGVIGNNEDLRPLIAEYAKNNNVDEAVAAQHLLQGVQKIMENQGKDQRQRAGGTPGENPLSVNKYNNFQY